MKKGRIIFLATLLMLFVFAGVSQAGFTYTYSHFDQQIGSATIGDTFSLNLSMDYGTALPNTGAPIELVLLSLNFGTSDILSVASFTSTDFLVTPGDGNSWTVEPWEVPISVGTSVNLGTFEFNAVNPGQTLITASVETGPGETLYDVPANSIGMAETAVPIPAAAWMLGSGLLGFGLIRRRK